MKDILIREAKSSDLDFVMGLMQDALEPFYGGDHKAHAERIFNTHIRGGTDEVGHFSSSQKMFILEVDKELAGMIHIVGKRQGTYKISPLILHSTYRSKNGLGGKLLKFAEEYVKQLGARQIYCTVAQQNSAAINFFTHNNYVVAGKSESHYKKGITEVMIYKLFDNEAFSKEFDFSQISVIPLEDVHKQQARQLILENLPKNFDGVDDSWVNALYDGYERRDTKDINNKFKIIYVAVNNSGEVSGIVGATPKKGEPIKNMPLIAKDFQSFIALLIDVPYLLKEYGHKIYTHINPNASEVIALQRFGWKLNALMPEAYKKGIITQQWSFDFVDDCVRALRVKSEYLEYVKKGTKTLEVRVMYPSIKKINTGDHLKMFDYNESLMTEVVSKRIYNSIEEMLEIEDSSKIIPGKSKNDLSVLFHQFYSTEKEDLGVVVFEIIPLIN